MEAPSLKLDLAISGGVHDAATPGQRHEAEQKARLALGLCAVFAARNWSLFEAYVRDVLPRPEVVLDGLSGPALRGMGMALRPDQITEEDPA